MGIRTRFESSLKAARPDNTAVAGFTSGRLRTAELEATLGNALLIGRLADERTPGEVITRGSSCKSLRLAH